MIMPAADPTAPTRSQCRPATLGGELRVALTRISRRLRSQRGEADLPEGQFGPYWIVYRYDSDPALADEAHQARSIWQLKSLTVR